MSQNDFSIANQTFPNTRSDINSAFQAAVSNSSGSSAPTTTYAYMWWYDTANDVLKMRAADDAGWIEVLSFDQVADTAVPSFITVDNNDSLSTDSATVPPSTRAVRQYISDEIDPNTWTERSSVTTTSGTLFDETSLPTSTSEIEIIFSDVSLSSNDDLLVQIGGASLVTTGYESSSQRPGATTQDSTSGFIITLNNDSLGFIGRMVLKKFPGSNEWVSDHTGVAYSDRPSIGGGRVDLGTALTRVRVTRTGSGNFDSGKFFVRYRG